LNSGRIGVLEGNGGDGFMAQKYVKETGIEC